jgi:hypothetical protein
MGNLKVLVTDQQKRVESAKDVLETALEKGFETVLVLGLKNNVMFMDYSSSESVAKTIGQIEILKADYIKDHLE